MKNQDKESMFDHLLGNLPGLVYRCKFDQDYTMLFLSESCKKLTGFDPEVIINSRNKAFQDIIHEDDLIKVWKAISQAMHDKTRFNITFRIKTKSGQIKWITNRGTGIYHDESLDPAYIEGYITDISELKNISGELSDREKRLHEVVKNVNVGIVLLEMNGGILEANKAMEEITGLSSAELIGKKPTQLARQLLKPKDVTNILPLVLKAMCGQQIQPFKVTIKKKILEIRTAVTGPKHVTAFVTDITQQKEFEDQIIQAKIKAEESDRLKSTFLANMSHEIRTPMNGIVGFTELLRDPQLSDEEKERYIDIIHANSEQLLNIINDILDISRIEAGRLGIFPSPFDPYVLLKNLQETTKILVKHKPINVVLKFDLPIGATIDTDKNRLQQILFNLISNATKFTQKGYIELGCHRINSHYIEFFIKDSGIGIRQNAGQKIFERFRQVEEGDNRPFGGTGLGLSICKSLVQLLGGSIGYVSTVGKGSQFYFTIPDELKSFK